MSKRPKHPVRRLFWDIETSPNLGFFWRSGFKLTVTPESIVEERKIICICYRWEGEETVHTLQWDSQQDDKAMLKAFLKVANEADELVAHNGDRFDMGWFMGRCLYHGIKTFPSYKTVDTLAIARKCYLNSYTLAYLAEFLRVPGKLKHAGWAMWKAVVYDNDRAALKNMVAYCQQDVRVLELVWQKLHSITTPKTHAGVLHGQAKWSCPHCGSTNVVLSKTRVTATGSLRYQMLCRDCGEYFTINAPAYKAYVKEARHAR